MDETNKVPETEAEMIPTPEMTEEEMAKKAAEEAAAAAPDAAPEAEAQV